MKKLLILASFTTLLWSCTNSEADHKEQPLSIGASDSLSSQSPTASKALSEEKEDLFGKSRKEEKKDNQESVFTALQGEWISESDSLAHLHINGAEWVLGYEGEELSQDRKFTFTLTDKLPQLVDPDEKAEFIVLSNKNDTMHYELNGVTEETLSLTYLPTMNILVYRKKK